MPSEALLYACGAVDCDEARLILVPAPGSINRLALSPWHTSIADSLDDQDVTRASFSWGWDHVILVDPSGQLQAAGDDSHWQVSAGQGDEERCDDAR
jgi:hypothetical protein